MSEITHYPNGGKCISCKHLFKDCSKHPFNTMKQIGRDNKTGLIMVNCTYYEKVD